MAPALAGLRANEARYLKNKYDHDFTVEPASNARETVDWVHRILKEERDLVIAARPLEATGFQVANIRPRRGQALSTAERSLSSISHAWSSVWKAECRMRNGSVHDRMRRATSPALYARIAAT